MNSSWTTYHILAVGILVSRFLTPIDSIGILRNFSNTQCPQLLVKHSDL
jgi:hypothetical protein